MKRLTKRQMRIFAVGQLGWSTLSGIVSAWFVTFYLPTQNDIMSGAMQFRVCPKFCVNSKSRCKIEQKILFRGLSPLSTL